MLRRRFLTIFYYILFMFFMFLTFRSGGTDVCGFRSGGTQRRFFEKWGDASPRVPPHFEHCVYQKDPGTVQPDRRSGTAGISRSIDLQVLVLVVVVVGSLQVVFLIG